jgi:hypothetical protein
MTTQLRIISLGAGVQSTTMALMAAHGELNPMPDCAIFADTGWEPHAVYEHLAWLMSPNVLPFPVHIVGSGNIREDLTRRYARRSGAFVTIPAYLLHKRGSKEGIGRRQCTSHYKVEPIRKKVRELLGRPKGPVPAGAAEKWIGISLDEVFRATPAKVQFEINRFPLLEKRISRRDCLGWLERNNYPTPPKSACIGCPFHNDAAWRAIRDNSPAEWQQAVEVDRAIRKPVGNLAAEQFLHPQRVPLDRVDLSTAEDHGQLNLFNNECEGLCGV